MSNVSGVHDLVSFVAGKTAPLTDQRLAKVGYKSTKNTPAAFNSVAVSVPFIQAGDIYNQIDSLVPHIKDWLEGVQDKVIRSLYENRDGRLSFVTDSDISIQACVSFLESEAAGDRLKKEHIELWFDRVCKDNTFTLIAEKLGFTPPDGEELSAAQITTVEKHVKTYRDILSMLAGGRTVLTPVQIKSCRTVIEVSEDDSGIGQKLILKLKSMETPKTLELLDL